MYQIHVRQPVLTEVRLVLAWTAGNNGAPNSLRGGLHEPGWNINISALRYNQQLSIYIEKHMFHIKVFCLENIFFDMGGGVKSDMCKIKTLQKHEEEWITNPLNSLIYR